MISEHELPPLRDLPPGRLLARKEHLLAEIAHQPQARPWPRPRRRLYATATLTGAALATALAVTLVAPWSHGPAAITPANAALILHKTVAAITPRPGWVFHERDQWSELVPGTSRRRTGTTELWVENKPPYRFRYLSDLPDLAAPVETGGTASSGRGFAFDPNTNTLYRQSVKGRVQPAFQDTAATLRKWIKHETAVGKAKVIGRTHIHGHNAYEIALFLAQVPIKLYVDATSYVPIELVWPGLRPLDGYWYDSTQRIVVYEYLPPTPANIRLADIQHTHPGATVAPASTMPQAFRNQVNPRYHTSAGR